MSASLLLLPAGILIATIALGILAALSVAGSRPSASRTAGVPAQLRCPMTGDLARVRIGVNLLTDSLSVLSCERFENDTITCACGCFPSQPLEALA